MTDNKVSLLEKNTLDSLLLQVRHSLSLACQCVNSRELSLAKTNLEVAEMWIERYVRSVELIGGEPQPQIERNQQ